MFLMYERVSYAALRPGKGWSDSSSTGVRAGCRNVPSSCMPYAPGSAGPGRRSAHTAETFGSVAAAVAVSAPDAPGTSRPAVTAAAATVARAVFLRVKRIGRSFRGGKVGRRGRAQVTVGRCWNAGARWAPEATMSRSSTTARSTSAWVT